MFTEFPDDAATFAMDDQWMVGDSLLVKPVTDAGATSVDVYLPSSNIWFDLSTLQEVVASSGPNGAKTSVSAPLDTIPVFIRGGKIVPRKMRLRRSSKLMFYDPYTLVVCPDKSQSAEGVLYMDDEITLAHESNHVFSFRKLSYSRTSNTATLSSTSANSKGIYKPLSTVERVEISGQASAPTRVTASQGSGGETIDLVSFFDASRGVVTIKKPDVGMAEDWTITLTW
jgi:alpha 1,3-glucosidase